MIYLASPHTHQSPLVMDQRYRWTAEYVIQQAKLGVVLFSPIMYFHPAAHMIPADFRFQEHDDKFLRISHALWVLKLPGWDLSSGVNHEMAYAKKLELPITFVEHTFANV